MWKTIMLDQQGKNINTVIRNDMNTPPNKMEVMVMHKSCDKTRDLIIFERFDDIINQTTKLWFKHSDPVGSVDWKVVFFDTDRANLDDTIACATVTLIAGTRPGQRKTMLVEEKMKQLKLFDAFNVSAIAEEAHIKTLKVFIQKKKTNKVDWNLDFFSHEGVLLASSTVQAYDGFKPTEDQIACAMINHDLESVKGFLRYDEDTKNRRVNIVFANKEQIVDKHQRLVAANKELVKQRAIISAHKAEIDKRQQAADKLRFSINATTAMITSLLTDVKSDSTEIKKFRCDQVSQKSAERRLLEDSFEKEMETIIALKEQSLKAKISFDSAFTDIIYILDEHKL